MVGRDFIALFPGVGRAGLNAHVFGEDADRRPELDDVAVSRIHDSTLCILRNALQYLLRNAYCYLLRNALAMINEGTVSKQEQRAERLRALLKVSRHGTVRELARAINKPATSLYGHFSGARNLSYDKAEYYARLFSSTPDWIWSGKRLNQVTGNAAIKGDVHIVPILVPLLSCHDIEQFRTIVAGENPMSNESVPVPPGVLASDRTYALKIEDKSMEGGDESIRQGEYAIVEPDQKYSTGNIVVAIDAPGFDCAIIRRYRVTSYDNDGKPQFDLAANNPDFPSVLHAHTLNVKIVGRVVGAFRVFT